MNPGVMSPTALQSEKAAAEAARAEVAEAGHWGDNGSSWSGSGRKNKEDENPCQSELRREREAMFNLEQRFTGLAKRKKSLIRKKKFWR